MSQAEITFLIFIAIIGHIMAGVWWYAAHKKWRICQSVIYQITIKSGQIKREVKNSIHTPIHALLLALCLWAGAFEATSGVSFVTSLIMVTIWAEIWHYVSHRAMHHPKLHWIHAEHHKSRLNSPFTAISFSFWEKLIFDIGIIVPFILIDMVQPVNFFGVATWFFGYLVINSFSHANFEFRPGSYNHHVGRYLTTTTYHSLHHSRYTGNYGLGTRFLDRWFHTEWPDYEDVYTQVVVDQKPLEHLRERAF